MSRKPIVFFSKMAQGVPSLGPVQRLLQAPFVSTRPATLTFHANAYPDLRRHRYIPALRAILPAGRIMDRASVIVSGAGHESVLGRYDCLKAMIFHGTYRFLKRENLEGMQSFNHAFLNGPRMERMLRRFGDAFPFSFSTVGYVPFGEFPEATDDNRARICAKLRLDPGKPVVFYAPARRSCGSWSECAEPMARDVPPDFNLVMRPHPNQALHGDADDRELYKRVSAIMRDRPHGVVDMGVCSFPELMSVADVLIGDATSPNEEFMLYDRPQIITETYPREHWRKQYVDGEMHADDIDELMSLYDCAYSFRRGSFDDWGTAVRTALANPEEHGPQRRAYFLSAFGPDGRGAAQRVARELKSMAETS